MNGLILRRFLRAIIAVEIIGLMYYLWKIAIIVIAEYSSVKSYKKVQEDSYLKTLKTEKTANIIKNLQELPYEG
jgi:hypothetical protein